MEFLGGLYPCPIECRRSAHHRTWLAAGFLGFLPVSQSQQLDHYSVAGTYFETLPIERFPPVMEGSDPYRVIGVSATGRLGALWSVSEHPERAAGLLQSPSAARPFVLEKMSQSDANVPQNFHGYQYGTAHFACGAYDHASLFVVCSSGSTLNTLRDQWRVGSNGRGLKDFPAASRFC
jgi:hypothetical protein